MKKMICAAALVLAVFSAHAGNGNNNDGCQGNCSGGGSDVTANGGNGYGGDGYGGSGGDATSVAVGVGVGHGGQGGSGGAGGSGGDGGNAIGVGGDGGSVRDSGNSHNLNANLNKNDATAISGSKSDADSASLSNAVSGSKSGATATNGGNTLTGGPTTVGGQTSANNTAVSFKTERNAPPVFLGALTPTSCGGGFNAGGSSRDGAGAFGIQWVGKECRIRMVGDRYHALGMVDTACEVYKTTKGFRDAAKVNPKLRDLDCTVKPAAVVSPDAPVIPKEFVEARTPRG